MKITPTKISDVKLIEPKLFGDERGFFMETCNEKAFHEVGITATFVQDNHSRSVKNNLYVDSGNFGQWVGECLSEENKWMLWVPPGFVHGFLVTSERADFQCKRTDFYAPKYERCIVWYDREVGVIWNVKDSQQPLLSEKDRCELELTEALIELKNDLSYRVV